MSVSQPTRKPAFWDGENSALTYGLREHRLKPVPPRNTGRSSVGQDKRRSVGHDKRSSVGHDKRSSVDLDKGSFVDLDKGSFVGQGKKFCWLRQEKFCWSRQETFCWVKTREVLLVKTTREQTTGMRLLQGDYFDARAVGAAAVDALCGLLEVGCFGGGNVQELLRIAVGEREP